MLKKTLVKHIKTKKLQEQWGKEQRRRRLARLKGERKEFQEKRIPRKNRKSIISKINEEKIIRDNVLKCNPKFNFKFSIVMATYNTSRYLEEAIQSVINQTYKNWELIIINDASTDNTDDVIKKYIKDYNIKYLKNNENKGIGYSKKRGCKQASGDIIAIVDGDDTIVENALHVMNKAYNCYPKYGVIYSTHFICDKNLENKKKAYWVKQLPYNSSNIDSNCVSALLTFKSELYKKIDGYDQSIKYATDKYIIFQLEEYSRFIFIPMYLYNYRRMRGSDIVKQSHNIYMDILEKARKRENSVSIVLGHKDYNKNLEIMLKSLESQNNRNFEVIIVDFKSKVPINYILDRYDIHSIKIIQADGNFERSKALNIGAKSSKNRRLFFTDADMILYPDFIDDIIKNVNYNKAWFPIVRNKTSNYNAKDRWRIWGYGNCGIMKNDFYFIKEWPEEFKKWGAEDNILNWKCEYENIEILRNKEIGIVHQDHDHLNVERNKNVGKMIKEYKKKYIEGDI